MKSLEDIYRKIEIERQRRIQSQIQEERRIQESRELARKEYLKKVRMYERFSIPSSSSAAGAGGGSLRIENTVSSSNAQSIIFIYNISINTYCRVFDFTNDSLSDELLLGQNFDSASISSIQESSYLVRTYDSNTEESGATYLINTSGQLISSKDYFDINTYFKYITLSYFEEDVKKIDLFDEGGLTTLELDNSNFISLDNHGRYSLYGYYFALQNEDSDYVKIYYKPYNGIPVMIKDYVYNYQFGLDQFWKSDLAFLFDRDSGNLIVYVYNGEDLLNQFSLSDVGHDNIDRSYFISESEFIVFGYNNLNISYNLYYNGISNTFKLEESDVYYYFSGTYDESVVDPVFSFLKSVPGYNGYFASLSGGNVISNYIDGSYTTYSIDKTYLSGSYISSGDSLAYISYDSNTSKLQRLSYSDVELQTDIITITSSLISSMYVGSLYDRFLIIYDSEDSSYKNTLLVGVDFISVGPTFSNYSYETRGKFAYITDNDINSSYFIINDEFIPGSYVNEEREYINYLSDDIKNESRLVVYDEEGFPLKYNILTSSGVSQDILPYEDFDVSKGDFYLSKDKFITVQNFSIFGAYYFSDSGDGDINIIEDGGDDMYDGANIISTNISEGTIPYTHTIR